MIATSFMVESVQSYKLGQWKDPWAEQSMLVVLSHCCYSVVFTASNYFRDTISDQSLHFSVPGYDGLLWCVTKRHKPPKKHPVVLPPYSQNVETKVGKCFLQLIDQCFPKTNPLHKIFNRKEINSWETKKNSKRHWILHGLALHVKCCLSLFSLRHISRRLYMSQSVLISCRAVDFLDTGFPPLLSFEVSAQF